MKRENIYKNYIFNTAYQIFILIIPLITMPYISRCFGAAKIGEYSYAESIAAIFVSIAPIGTVAYGRREISYHQGNREQQTKIFWNVLSLKILSSLVCCLIYMVYLHFYKFNIIQVIMIINIVSTVFDVSWLFQGVEDFKLIAARNFIVKFVMICCIFTFIHGQKDFYLYVLIMCGSTFLGNISIFTRLKIYVDKPVIKEVNPFENFKTVLSLFLPTVALTVAAMLDKPIIGWLTDDYSQSGYYDQSQKIISVLMLFITSMATVTTARVGYHFERKELNKIYEYMYRNYRFVTLIAIPMCLGITAVAHLLIPIYLGNGYEGAIPVISILGFTILAVGINNVTGVQYLIPTKKQTIFTKSIIVGMFFNFTLDVLLVPHFGACGAVFATVVAEIMINVVQLITIRNEISFFRIVKQAKNYVMAGIFMFAVILVIDKFALDNQWKLIIMVSVGIVVYSSILIIVKDEFVMNYLKVLDRKIKEYIAK
jgi:O-antigen/teichoic acid export membrane protein